MSKKLSEPKVSAALKSAAYDAVHGSRDARSGRVLAPAKDNTAPRSGTSPKKG